MKKQVLLALLPSALLFAGCTSTPGANQGTSPAGQAKEALKIAQIMERGGSAFCTVTDLSDNTSTEMTISGKKMKIVGGNSAGGKKGTIINDSAYIYSWEEGQTTGFRMKLPSEEESKEVTQKAQQNQQELDIDTRASAYDDETKYKLNCDVKNIPDTEFTPPSTVKFIDPSQMQNLSPQQLQDLYSQDSQDTEK